MYNMQPACVYGVACRIVKPKIQNLQPFSSLLLFLYLRAWLKIKDTCTELLMANK